MDGEKQGKRRNHENARFEVIDPNSELRDSLVGLLACNDFAPRCEQHPLDDPPNSMFRLVADVFAINRLTAIFRLPFKHAVDAVLDADGSILQIGVLLYQHVKQIADFDAKEVFSLLLIFNDEIGVFLHENQAILQNKKLYIFMEA
jgi:hypothetical protein